MRDFRSILNIIGILICIEAVAMLIPMFFDLYYGNYDWLQFFYSSLITFFIGIILYFSFRKKNIKLGIRQAFLLTISSWLVISLFGAIPFVYSSSSLSYTDAFFESVSGITTTGATVINNLENLSEGILIWRSLLQWFGGIGIIVLAMAILPTLQIGGMQLLHMEHDDPYEKTIPKVNRFVIELFLRCFTRDSMASAIESFLVFFAVANFKGGRYIRITSIFAMGVLETYLSVEAIMPQNSATNIQQKTLCTTNIQVRSATIRKHKNECARSIVNGSHFKWVS